MNFRFVGNAETVENIAIFYPKSFTTFSISVSYKKRYYDGLKAR